MEKFWKEKIAIDRVTAMWVFIFIKYLNLFVYTRQIR